MKTSSVLGLAALAVLSMPVDASSGERAEKSPSIVRPEADRDAGVRCELRKPTGSSRVARVCTTAEERALATAKAQDDLHRLGRCSGNETACRGE